MTKFVRILLSIATALGVAGLILLPSSPASAVQTPQDHLVSPIPASFTPSAVDGSVQSIIQMGNTIIMGGDFTQVEAAGSTTVLSRPDILAFDATTGELSTTFMPALDGEVEALLPSADGNSVFVGGDFHTVNGKATKSLTELSLSDGTTVAAFKTPSTNGKVKDLRLAGGNLWVAGSFTKIGGVTQTGLATLNPATGAVNSYDQLQVAGLWNGGTTTVAKMDITPDGSKLLAIGNFTTVGGASRPQAFMLDLSGASAQLANWQTNFYTSHCSNSFDSYLRDLDISPDGSYAVISTTGAYGGATSACDETSRWNMGATGSGLTPAWTDYTGGDTTYAVAITGSVVYTGGHARWQNNAFKGDSPGQGAVSRPGIAALDPANGLPYSWNPMRERGVGVFDLLATDAGLWVGSDTDQIGDFNYHGKIAFLPLAGGEVIPPTTTGVLPGNVYLAGSTQPTNPNILYRVDAGGPALPSLDDGPNWAEDDNALTSTLHNTGGTATSYSCCATRGAALPDSAPTGLFNTERTDPTGGNEMQWHFPVPAGQHVDVRLYFANRSSSTTRSGQRTFDVTLDTTKVLTSYDAVADVGNAVGTMKTFPVVSDGTVDVSFAHKINNPMISGIEIVRTDGPTPPSPDMVQNVGFDGTSVIGYSTLPDTGVSWHLARGATMINGKVYYGYTDGQLYSRTFDGTTFGAATAVNGMDLITPLTDFHTDVPNITSMFFDSGRLYFTLNGDSHLYYRYFTPESNVIGAVRYTASNGITGMNFASASGMFVAGGKLYLATSNGNLQESDFVDGAPSGTGTVISGPSLDNTNWSSRAMFLYAPAGGGGTNQPPTARMSADCQDLVCTVTGDGSSDPEGLLSSYQWDFGDGTSSTQADDTHTYASAGTYTVTLKVTDAGGLSDTTNQTIHVGSTGPAVAFVGSNATQGNATSQTVAVPSGVAADNGMVLVSTVASETVTATAPAGWTQVGQTTSKGMTSTVWQRVATDSDAGTSVKVTYSALVKSTVSVFAYSGTSATTPVLGLQGAGETVSQAGHTTPTVPITDNRTWALSYWADDSSATTTWNLPAGVTARSAACGTGGGHICSASADSNGPVPGNQYGGLTATADSTSSKAVMWTVLLATASASNQPPTARLSVDCQNLGCSMTGDTSSDPEGPLASYAWDFGDGGTSTQADPTHTYAGAGTYTVTLKVTDSGGVSDTATKSVTVSAAGITFVGSDQSQGNLAKQSVTVPAGISGGDGMVLVTTVANDAITATAPDGWTQVGQTSSKGMASTIWQRVAVGGDAGSSVKVTYSGIVKATVQLFAYDGTSATNPIAGFQGAGETVSQAGHTTPTVPVADNRSWALSYWADSSSATTSWNLPAGVTSRSTVCGTGGGHICAATADSNGAVSASQYGGLTATADSTGAKAIMWTIVLQPS
jgi:PKD repeat protein